MSAQQYSVGTFLFAVLSVWRRHCHVYRKTAVYSFFPPMTEPIVYFISFGYGLAPLVREVTYYGENVEYIRFIAAGMMAIGVLYQSYLEGSYSTFVRLVYQRTWHAQLTTPLTYSEVYFGDLLWAATKGVIAGFLTGIVAVLWGAMSFWELVLDIPILAAGGIVFGALGMFSTGNTKRIEYINIPLFLFIVPMFSLCGMYFPRSVLPDGIEVVTNVLPLSNLVDLLRWSIHPPSSMGLTIGGLFAWAALFIALSWRLIRNKIYR